MTSWLNSPILLALLIIIPPLIAFLKKRRFSWLMILGGELLGIFSSQIIKRLTAQPRPFFNNPHVLGVKTNIPNDFSFPSIHTVIATLFAWTMSYFFPRLAWLWFSILVVVASSRVYFGLHYPRDILGGFALATFLFWAIFLTIHFRKFLAHSQNVNVRRKLFHLFYGLGLVILINQQLMNRQLFTALTTIIFILYLVFPRLPPNWQKIIKYFERNNHSRYLQGPFLFTLSAFFSYLLFPRFVAMAAILNLAVGDSINALVGSFLASPRKHLTATLAAAGATFLLIIPYLSLLQALAGSLITAFLEYSEPKWRGRKIDDNLLIPPLSGLAMLIFRYW